MSDMNRFVVYSPFEEYFWTNGGPEIFLKVICYGILFIGICIFVSRYKFTNKHFWKFVIGFQLIGMFLLNTFDWVALIGNILSFFF